MRKICVVTGTRAEYGLLFWIMKRLQKDPEVHLQIIASAMHLSPEFGLTYQEIEKDQFFIDAKVDMLLSSDTAVSTTKSLGLGTIGFADAFNNLKPDLIVVLGDRYEVLAASQAAMIARIPIAHIHGGEISEGAFDESIRHSITKMAWLHFPAADSYRRRIIQMGEAPERVFNFGAPGIEYISNMSFLSKEKLEEELDISLNNPLFLVTYHPTTLIDILPEKIMQQILEAFFSFPEATIIFTHPNSDTNGRVLIKLIDEFVLKSSHRAKSFKSLGQQKYLSLMKLADVIIGNSSSALIEAPAMKKATVNLGDRQKGRLKASSVIDTLEDKTSIENAIKLALSPQFRNALQDTQSLYGYGDVSLNIVKKLKNAPLFVQKPFFNIEYESR